MSEISLTADGERALREAQNLCWQTNVAIVAPEHLLAGALHVLNAAGTPHLPDDETIASAVVTTQGQGSAPLSENVMFGSSARDVINGTAAAVREAGGTRIDARILAAGAIESGELNPMFYSALGISKTALLDALGAAS